MSTPLGGTAAPPEPSGERVGAGRGRGTVRDLVISLAVLLAVISVVVLAAPRESGTTVREIDYSGALADARRVAKFPVVGPEGLPVGWRATSARTDRRNNTTHWHLGMVTPTEEYASVEQSDREPVVFVGEMTERGPSQGVTEIGTATWVRTYSSLRNHRALWTTSAGVSTVVGGTADWPELEQLARSLRAPATVG